MNDNNKTKYVEIIPETKTDRDSFTYQIPNEMTDQVYIGSIVRIEFGKRKIRGVVQKIFNTQKAVSYKLKNITSVENNLCVSADYLKMSKWISKYYLCSLGEAISIFLPPDLKKPRASRKEKKIICKKLNQLTSIQDRILKKLTIDLQLSKKKPSLIYGVTGSGKTEIYLHLAKKTLELGKSVVLLVPEIVLTPQNIERFEEIFGQDVVLMHSGLSKSEKFHCYRAFNSGQKKIIIGPRSTLLVPSENIGLIIVDEEQEESYKQEQNPRYDALILAEKIAKVSGALLLVGSATPRIETYYKAKSGRYNLYSLLGRYNSLTLPVAEIVDLKNEIKKENFSPISERMQEAIGNVLKKKQQAILFLNRRGMATFVSCRDCGYIVNCDQCEVPMIQHLDINSNTLVCHHCGRKKIVPRECPDCKNFRIKFFGSGVEKIELEIKSRFPKARIKRVDSKVLQNHKDYQNFYQDFKNHKFDIVIGTQIIAKGFDIPGVSLVGIISADVGLHMPYFRASEKIFRLLTQVSGRSGRRSQAGQTIIQTYWPQSTVILFAAKHDFQGFYKAEITKRIKKNYPPKTHIIRVLSENKDEGSARLDIKKLASSLTANKINFIGPGPCFFTRINGRFRFQIIIKINNLPDKNISDIRKNYQNLTWDVDAINLL